MNYSQNFLVDDNIISKILSHVTHLRPIIEVGCGKGNLSRKLNPDLCLELDSTLLPFLRNYNPVHGDARKLPIFRGQIVSSLPYSITFDFFNEVMKVNRITRLLLILQEDFIDKIFGYPTFLSFVLNYYFSINKLMVIPPTAFRPIPRVFSALASFDRKREYDKNITEVIRCISRFRNKTLKKKRPDCVGLAQIMRRE